MKPTEKAKTLVNRFYYSLPNNGSYSGINNVESRYNEAKQCALIAIDEILNSITRKKYLVEIGEWIETPENNYWQQVQEEIEKL